MTRTPGPATTPENEAAEQQPGRAHLASVARGGTLNLVGATVTALVGVAVTATVTRTVPQATAGVYFAVTALFLLLAMIGRLGSGTGLVYFVSRFRALGRPDEVGTLLRLAIRPVVLVSSAIAAALVVTAPYVAPVVVSGHHAQTVSYLRQVAPFLPLAVLADMYQAVSRGYGTMRPTALVSRIGRPLVQLPAVALAAVTGGALLGVAWAVPYLPAAVLSVWWVTALRRRRAMFRHLSVSAVAIAMPDTDNPPESYRVLRRRYWAYAVPRAFTGIAQVALQRFDVILVGVLRGPAEAAVYTAATRFLVVGQLGNQAISMAAQPQIGGLLAAGDRRRTNEVYQSATAWLVLMTWPVYLLCAVFAPQLLVLLFGSGYADGSVVIAVLAAAMLMATACGAVGTMLSMAGRTTWNLADITLALAVNVAVDVALIPPYGVLGAAVGWAAAILVNNLLPLAQVWRGLGLHPLGRGLAGAAVLAGGCFGVLPLAVRLGSGGSMPATGAAAAVGVVAYAAGLWRLRAPLHLDLLLEPLRRARHL